MSVITEKFKKAGVPPSCWKIKCEETGRGAINAWAADLKTKSAERGALLSAYVQMPDADDRKEAAKFAAGQEFVELLARQAVVSQMAVLVVPFYKLIHNLENVVTQRGFDEEPEEPIVVLVVPYLPAPALAVCTPYQYAMVVDHLLSHIYEGGAVVIGGCQVLSKRLQSRYPMPLERMLVENSELFGV